MQEKLKAAGAFERGPRGAPPRHAVLAGKLFDDTGDRFTPTHSKRKGQRITYYISSRLLKAGKLDRSASDRGWRLPGRALEQELAEAIGQYLSAHLADLLTSDATSGELARASESLTPLKPPLTLDQTKALLGTLKRADLACGEAKITLCGETLASLLCTSHERIELSRLAFTIPFRTRKRGQETQLLIGAEIQGKPDPVLLGNMAKAQAIYADLKRGKSFAAIAKVEQVSTRRVMQILDLAFLSPRIVRRLLAGEQPAALTTKWLMANPLPSDWKEQDRIVAAL